MCTAGPIYYMVPRHDNKFFELDKFRHEISQGFFFYYYYYEYTRISPLFTTPNIPHYYSIVRPRVAARYSIRVATRYRKTDLDFQIFPFLPFLSNFPRGELKIGNNVEEELPARALSSRDFSNAPIPIHCYA